MPADQTVASGQLGSPPDKNGQRRADHFHMAAVHAGVVRLPQAIGKVGVPIVLEQRQGIQRILGGPAQTQASVIQRREVSSPGDQATLQHPGGQTVFLFIKSLPTTGERRGQFRRSPRREN